MRKVFLKTKTIQRKKFVESFLSGQLVVLEQFWTKDCQEPRLKKTWPWTERYLTLDSKRPTSESLEDSASGGSWTGNVVLTSLSAAALGSPGSSCSTSGLGKMEGLVWWSRYFLRCKTHNWHWHVENKSSKHAPKWYNCVTFSDCAAEFVDNCVIFCFRIKVKSWTKFLNTLVK